MPQISSPPGPENKLPTAIKALIFGTECVRKMVFFKLHPIKDMYLSSTYKHFPIHKCTVSLLALAGNSLTTNGR